MKIAEPVAPAIVECAHCASPVPPGLVERGAHDQFCCAGCRAVHDLLRSTGLDAYYALRAGERSGAARVTGRAYEEFDDPAFLRAHARAAGGGSGGLGAGGGLRADLVLDGLHCAACLWLVERLPVVCPGVVESRLDMRRARVSIAWDPTRTTLAAAARALDSLGYPSRPAKGTTLREERRRQDRRALARLGIAGALAGNSMLVAFALYAGMFDAMDASFRLLFRAISMAFGLASILGPGMVFFRGAMASIRARSPSLDVPIALGLGVGGAWGASNTIRATGEIYFDSLAVLVFLLLVGRWIQSRQQRGAADEVELLFSLTPSSARLVEPNGVRTVPVEALRAGDLVDVLAGESIPADARVIRGESSIDASLLTGESRPIEVSAGDAACAGTVNLASPLRLRVEASGDETRVARLVRLVGEASARRAPIVRLADRIAGGFVIGVALAALATFVAWLIVEPASAPEHMAALLIVTCPCALGMATPLAMTAAIGQAARRGILVKGADAFQTLSTPGTLVLDKTGTVTDARLRVGEWTGDRETLSLAAALERTSSHPIARAIREASPDDGELGVRDARQVLGAGIEGTVAGRRVRVGAPGFIPEPTDHTLRASLSRAIDTAATPVLVEVDGLVRGVAALTDPIRPGARASIDRLRGLGWRVELLSGDHPDVARAVGSSLGLEPESVRGGATPDDKLAHVRSRPRPVVMVGDGVNDAAALAGADVGVAVHASAEASLEAADVYLSNPGLGSIVELVEASGRTMRAIRVCFGVSIGYNALAGSLAALGVINPLIAAVLMPLSSFSVLAIATRWRTFGGGR